MRRLVIVSVVGLAGLAAALPATAGGGDVSTGAGPVVVDTKHICVGTSPERRGGDVDSYCVSIDLPVAPPR